MVPPMILFSICFPCQVFCFVYSPFSVWDCSLFYDSHMELPVIKLHVRKYLYIRFSILKQDYYGKNKIQLGLYMVSELKIIIRNKVPLLFVYLVLLM